MHTAATSLQKSREKYQPQLPSILKNLDEIEWNTSSVSDSHVKELFPHTSNQSLLTGKKGKKREHSPARIGVVFSGGQAPGGHNVVTGIFDALHTLNTASQLFGFLGGPSGIIEANYKELTAPMLQPFRNQGGFELLGSGRTKIETEEQLEASLATVLKLQLNALIIIGGDDSNTTAAVLAEYFLKHECKTCVIGVPKTIDGDLKNTYVSTSFGFDTACKTYAETIGNIARDALSAKKYYHFIKLMGRSASHVALECALTTHPNMTLIGEELAQKKMTLAQITSEIADLICARAALKKNYGVILIPEGIVEFIPEIALMIQELNRDLDVKKLTAASKNCFETLPESIQRQLLLHRDPHGNVQVSAIETERLLIETVAIELKKRSSYKGSFSAVPHFLGYEGRAAFPTNFDCNYCYTLGYVAALLALEGATSVMCCVQKLTSSPEQWEIAGVPLTSLLKMEMRKGKEKPVIEKALVDIQGPAFLHFCAERKLWMQEDHYLFPGPIQFYGDPELINTAPYSLHLEEGK